jgi:hypothetical protein
MPNLTSAVADYVDRLRAAGVRASADTRDINPPCVHINPPEVAYRFGKGWDATWRAYAIAPDSGPAESLEVVGELLENTQAALAGLVVTARPAELLTLDGGPPLPAYELNWTSRLH